MRYLLTGFVLVLIFLTNSELSADKVYTWTDKDGNMHITAEPPPQNARVKDVLQYEPRPEQNFDLVADLNFDLAVDLLVQGDEGLRPGHAFYILDLVVQHLHQVLIVTA